MSGSALKEQAQAIKTVSNPKLKALLTELLKHVQHQDQQEKKESGCG